MITKKMNSKKVETITEDNDICPNIYKVGESIKLTKGTKDIILMKIDPSNKLANKER